MAHGVCLEAPLETYSETHSTSGQDAMSISLYLKRSDEHVSEQSEMENKTLDSTVRKLII